MDFALNDEQKLLKNAVREFAESEIAPAIEHMEKTGVFPPELMETLGRQGLLGLNIPGCYGGTEMGFIAELIALEELSRISCAAGMALMHHLLLTRIIAAYGKAGQKEKYLPLLAQGRILGAVALNGSDDSFFATVSASDGYLLSGKRQYIVNMPLAGLVLVAAKTGGSGSSPAGYFILESENEGVLPGPSVKLSGLKGCAAGGLTLDKAPAGYGNMLGGPVAGDFPGTGAAIYGSFSLAAVALGLMEACVEKTLNFATQRILYKKPIANLQPIGFRLAEMYADLEASRLLAFHTGWLLEQTKAQAIGLHALQSFVLNAACMATRKSLDTHGGYGSTRGFVVERLFRDAQTLSSFRYRVHLPG